MNLEKIAGDCIEFGIAYTKIPNWINMIMPPEDRLVKLEILNKSGKKWIVSETRRIKGGYELMKVLAEKYPKSQHFQEKFQEIQKLYDDFIGTVKDYIELDDQVKLGIKQNL